MVDFARTKLDWGADCIIRHSECQGLSDVCFSSPHEFGGGAAQRDEANKQNKAEARFCENIHIRCGHSHGSILSCKTRERNSQETAGPSQQRVRFFGGRCMRPHTRGCFRALRSTVSAGFDYIAGDPLLNTSGNRWAGLTGVIGRFRLGLLVALKFTCAQIPWKIPAASR